MKIKYFWDDEQMPSPKQKIENIMVKGEETVNQLPERGNSILECNKKDIKKKDDIIHK